MNNPYSKPESNVAVGAAAGANAEVIESRRQMMMRTFYLTIAGLVLALILMGVLGGQTGAAVGIAVYVVAIIAGLVSFVYMLMLTSSLHGGGWVAANLVGSLLIPLYSLIAMLVLNSQARKRLA